MSWAKDFASLIEAHCNQERIVEEPGGPVAYGMELNHSMFIVMTPTCSLVEREQILAELPMWAQRQIERSAAEHQENIDRFLDAARRRGSKAA